MTLDNDRDALRELEPPRGGLERFEQRLDNLDGSSRARRAKPLLVAAGLAVALLVVVAASLLRRPDVEAAPTVYEAPAFDRLLGRPMEEAPMRIAINDEPVSVSLVTGAGSNIRIYEIERNR